MKRKISEIPEPPKFDKEEIKSSYQEINYDEEIKKLQKAKKEKAERDNQMIKELKSSVNSEELIDLGKVKVYLNENKSKVKFGGKHDGYILYRKLNRRWQFIKVDNFKDVYKIAHKHYAYIVDNVVGFFEDGKPFFIVDERIPITLNTSARSSIVDENGEPMFDGKDLCYDGKAFYVYLDTITLKNLTPKESSDLDFMKFLKDYWWIILIVLALMLFLFLTPMGKDLLQKLADSIPKNVTRN